MNIRKTMILAALAGFVVGSAASLGARPGEPADPNLASLARLFDLQEKIRKEILEGRLRGHLLLVEGWRSLFPPIRKLKRWSPIFRKSSLSLS